MKSLTKGTAAEVTWSEAWTGSSRPGLNLIADDRLCESGGCPSSLSIFLHRKRRKIVGTP